MRRWLFGLARIAIVAAVAFIVSGLPDMGYFVDDPKTYVPLALIVVIGAWFIGPKTDKDPGLWGL